MDNQKYLAERKLIEDLKANMPAGAEALYDMYSNTLMGVLFKMVNDQELAESLLQQSIAMILASVQSYDPSKGNFFTWIIAITRNLAKNCINSNKFHEKSAIEPLAFNNRSIDPHQNQFSGPDAIMMNLGAGKIMHNDVLDLIYYKGHTPAEVAEKLNIPINMVRIYYRRAICIMRQQLA